MKTKFTTITMFVLVILGTAANAERTKSEIGKQYFLNAKKELLSNSKNTHQFKQLFVSENQLSVPGNSEDFSWDEDLNDWRHDSNTSYTYDDTGILTEEIAQEAGTDIYLTRDTYSYGSGKTFEEVSYVWAIDEWMPVNGQRKVNTFFETILMGAVEQSLENGIWVNKNRVQYIYGNNNIPTGLQTYLWNGAEWVINSKSLNITWADWQNRELATYTMQNMQGNDWVNAERYSKQYDGHNYTTTTEVWENDAWVNSTRETYSRTSFEEELILENWTETGWVKTEKYQGTFDAYGNPTGMFYSSWYDINWELEMELFFDLLYNESNDVTEMLFRYRDPEISEPVNISKYNYSSFLHFTTDVPEISVLNNVKVFPNPVSNTFIIQIDENKSAHYKVSIVNLAGQTVFSNSYSNAFITINTEKFTTGMYLLQIKTDDGRIHNCKLLKN
jgi:hypothetical protein